MEIVSNKEFIAELSERTGFTKKDIGKVTRAMEEIILDNLKDAKATKFTFRLTVAFHDTKERMLNFGHTAPARRKPRLGYSQSFKDELVLK